MNTGLNERYNGEPRTRHCRRVHVIVWTGESPAEVRLRSPTDAPSSDQRILDTSPFGSPSEMQSLSKNLAVALGAMTVGCLLTGLVMSLPQGLRSDVYAQQQEEAAEARERLETAQDLSSAFRNISDALRPSVVSISTKFAAETV